MTRHATINVTYDPGGRPLPNGGDWEAILHAGATGSGLDIQRVTKAADLPDGHPRIPVDSWDHVPGWVKNLLLDIVDVFEDADIDDEDRTRKTATFRYAVDDLRRRDKL